MHQMQQRVQSENGKTGYGTFLLPHGRRGMPVTRDTFLSDMATIDDQMSGARETYANNCLQNRDTPLL